ncbi:MAG: tetratricopeptide repeat protein, partial [Dehalococcoidia bacterium]
MAQQDTKELETAATEAGAELALIQPQDWVTAEARARLGLWEKRVETLVESLKVATKEGMTPDDWLMQARAWASLERWQDALLYYGIAAKKLSRFRRRHLRAGAYRERADVLYRLGRYEEALASYDRSLELRPDAAATLNNRGIALDDLGRYEEA